MSDIGSLVIVNIPFTDRSGSKNRPGVVVAEYLQDYQIVYMTKEVDKYLHESSSMQIGNEDISEGKLRQTSLIRAHKTNWVEKKSCKLIGKLKKEFLEKLLRKTRSSSFLNTAAPSGCLSGTRTTEDFFPARLKIGDLRPLVLKQLDCRNAWQGKSLISFGFQCS